MFLQTTIIPIYQLTYSDIRVRRSAIIMGMEGKNSWQRFPYLILVVGFQYREEKRRSIVCAQTICVSNGALVL
jgi:hypothetical protein